MIRLIAIFTLALTLAGCKDLKEQQLGAYVGDSQTKVVYKNVGKNTEVVPKERRVFFRSADEAMEKGYTMSNVADSGGSGQAEDQ